MKKLSKSGGLIKSTILIILGILVIEFLLPRFDAKVLSFVFKTLIIALIFIRLLTRSLSFDQQYIKLGNSKIPYGQIDNLWWFGYNFEHYVIFKIKDRPFYNRYFFVDLKLVSLKEIFNLITNKEHKLSLTEFAENLKSKTSLSHSRIDKVLSE